MLSHNIYYSIKAILANNEGHSLIHRAVVGERISCLFPLRHQSYITSDYRIF